MQPRSKKDRDIEEYLMCDNTEARETDSSFTSTHADPRLLSPSNQPSATETSNKLAVFVMAAMDLGLFAGIVNLTSKLHHWFAYGNGNIDPHPLGSWMITYFWVALAALMGLSCAAEVSKFIWKDPDDVKASVFTTLALCGGFACLVGMTAIFMHFGS